MRSKRDEQYLIYALFDPRTFEIRYVGQTSQGLYRPYCHAHPARRRNSRQRHITRWIEKLLREGVFYGVAVLEYCQTASGLDEAEQSHIKECKALGYDLINHTEGGHGMRGHKQTPRHRAKIAAAHRGKRKSPEHRASLSSAALGRNLGPQSLRHKNAISLALVGKAKNPEHRRKIGDAIRQRVKDPEYLRKLSERMRGRKLSAQARQNMSIARKGRHFGPMLPKNRQAISRARGARPFMDQFGWIYYSNREAARKLGLDSSTLTKVLKGKVEKTKGYTFRYCD